jgi:hypothetical protein
MRRDDKRKTGEGAMRGWATRRQRALERRKALDCLYEVSDSITSELTVGVRLNHDVEPENHSGKYVVGALTLINWRDRVASALRRLEAQR